MQAVELENASAVPGPPESDPQISPQTWDRASRGCVFDLLTETTGGRSHDHRLRVPHRRASSQTREFRRLQTFAAAAVRDRTHR
jgi:hypothetical protein